MKRFKMGEILKLDSTMKNKSNRDMYVKIVKIETQYKGKLISPDGVTIPINPKFWKRASKQRKRKIGG